MSPAELHKTLIELGWTSMTQRVLGGRPAEAFTLRYLMQRPGRPVSVRQLAEAYADIAIGTAYGARPRVGATTTDDAVRTRVRRLRRELEDLGLAGVVKTVGADYVIQARDVPRVEAAILYACGIEIAEAA